MPILSSASVGASGVVTVAANCLAIDAIGNCVKVTGPDIAGIIQVATVDVADPSTALTVGVIISKSTATDCIVQLFGRVTNVYAGLQPGKFYFVNTTGVPDLVPPAPLVGGIAYVQAIGVALSATEIFLQPLPPTKRIG
jgi:hypothetical protein